METAKRPEEEKTVQTGRKMLIVDTYYGASQDPSTEGFAPEVWNPTDDVRDVVRKAAEKETDVNKSKRILEALEKGNPIIYEGNNPKFRGKEITGPIGKYLDVKNHEGTDFMGLVIRLPEPQEGGIIAKLVEGWEKFVKRYAKPENSSGSSSMYGI